MKRIAALSAFLFSTALVTSAMAQNDGIIYKKRSVLIYTGGDTIKGDLDTPDIGIIHARKVHKHNNLIRVRSNFTQKTLKSIFKLRR